MSEERKSKIAESYRVLIIERLSQYYEVRAENEDEAYEYHPSDLKVLVEDQDYIDSDREETVRILTDEEDKERLHFHQMWKDGDPEGERYYVKGAEIHSSSFSTAFGVTPAHHGAIFEDCSFSGGTLTFDGVDFGKIDFLGCKFDQNITLNDCKGLEVEELAKPGDLWFDKTIVNYKDGTYAYKPVIITKWKVHRLGMQTIQIEFEGIKDGETTTSFRTLQKEPNG